MKKKSTTIVLIVIIIGLIGSGGAFYMMKNSDPIDDQSTNPSSTSTTQEKTTEDNLSQVQSPTDIITVPEEGTQVKDYIGKTGEISIDETFEKLDEYYGKGYDINCFDYSEEPPTFTIVDMSTGDVYAYVVVDLDTAIATETIQSTQETKEFSLFG